MIKTQEDLDRAIEIESGMYYISICGDIVTFGGAFTFDEKEVLQNREKISISQSQMYRDIYKASLKDGGLDSLSEEEKSISPQEVLDTCIKTYTIPYRIH